MIAPVSPTLIKKKESIREGVIALVDVAEVCTTAVAHLDTLPLEKLNVLHAFVTRMESVMHAVADEFEGEP